MVHGEPGPNRTGLGPNIGTILKDFLGTISATERDYFRIVPTFKVVSLKSAWYGPFERRGIKHVMHKVRKKLINPCEFSKCYDHKAFMIHL